MKETASLAAVESLVASAPTIHTLPANLNPPLGATVLGWPYEQLVLGELVRNQCSAMPVR